MPCKAPLGCAFAMPRLVMPLLCFASRCQAFAAPRRAVPRRAVPRLASPLPRSAVLRLCCARRCFAFAVPLLCRAARRSAFAVLCPPNGVSRVVLQGGNAGDDREKFVLTSHIRSNERRHCISSSPHCKSQSEYK